MRSFRQNVIVSHGGQHGASSRTLRKGTAPTRKDLEQIPDHVLGAVTGLGVDAPGGDPATEKRMDARDKKLVEAGKTEAKAKAKAKAKAAKPKDKAKPKPEAKAKAKPEPKAKTKTKAERLEDAPFTPAPKEPAAPSVTMPTTKRGLFLLKKADAVVLLAQLGIEHAEDISGKDAKELLANTLGLE